MARWRWLAGRRTLALVATTAMVLAAPAFLGSRETPDGSGVTGASASAAEVASVQDLSGVVSFLPPVGDVRPNDAVFDASLAEHLTVTVSLPQDGVESKTVTELRAPLLVLKNGRYQVTWKAPARHHGDSVLILVRVAELPVGATEFTVQGKRALPVKFTVANHPRVRTAALHAEGLPALAVARALVQEFGVTAAQATLLLAEDRFQVRHIGEVLHEVFGLQAEPAAELLSQHTVASASEIADVLAAFFGLADEPTTVAQILKGLGLGMASIADALESVFGLDTAALLAVLKAIGFTSEELFGLQARELAAQFAPQLRFDQASSTFPMSAEKYFLETVQGTAGKQENRDSSTLQSATKQPPTYYRAYLVGNQVRILYWWFYGYQQGCFGAPGAYHHGDWERVLVTIKEDQSGVASVTYWQHGGWYTRLADGGDRNPSIGADYGPGFQLSGEHPIVFVGKVQHGSYHDQGGRGDSRTGLSYCDYFADWRNNRNATHLRMNSENNLVGLFELEEQWMVEESLFSGIAEPEILGQGDGSTTAYNVRSVRVDPDPDRLDVYLDGVKTTDVGLSDGSGPGGVDQIVLSSPPENGVVVSASYRSASFKWGPHGTDSEKNVGTHPVRSSASERIVGIKACEGYDATVFGATRGCFASQCKYRNGQNLYTDFHPGKCSSCPAGYTDNGEFCGKGDWWNPFSWSTRAIQKYDLAYTLPTSDRGLCTR